MPSNHQLETLFIVPDSFDDACCLSLLVAGCIPENPHYRIQPLYLGVKILWLHFGQVAEVVHWPW